MRIIKSKLHVEICSTTADPVCMDTDLCQPQKISKAAVMLCVDQGSQALSRMGAQWNVRLKWKQTQRLYIQRTISLSKKTATTWWQNS